MTILTDVSKLTDQQLLADMKATAGREARTTAMLIALLGEFDARRLYLGEGCASLFTYCTQVLHLSEHAAYGRIEVARAARKYPVIVELLATRAITLTTVTLLARYLTTENHEKVLHEARHGSKRYVEQLIARYFPQPDVLASVSNVSNATTPPIVAPLAPDRFKVQLTIGRETYDKLRRVQDLLRHSIPKR